MCVGEGADMFDVQQSQLTVRDTDRLSENKS